MKEPQAITYDQDLMTSAEKSPTKNQKDPCGNRQSGHDQGQAFKAQIDERDNSRSNKPNSGEEKSDVFH
jgi:hypothetical protein